MISPRGAFRLDSASVALGAAGLVAATLGTFLPWLQSGDVRRNSYSSLGVLRRLLGVGGAQGMLLSAWPFLGLFCAAAVVGFVFGLRRSAALAALVVGAAATAVAVTALQLTGTGPVRHVSTGPLVTIAGAILTVLAATLFLIVQCRIPRRHAATGTRSST